MPKQKNDYQKRVKKMIEEKEKKYKGGNLKSKTYIVLPKFKGMKKGK